MIEFVMCPAGNGLLYYGYSELAYFGITLIHLFLIGSLAHFILKFLRDGDKTDLYISAILLVITIVNLLTFNYWVPSGVY